MSASRLSFWVPGLGQLYNGEWLKGVGLLAASTLIAVSAGDGYVLASAGLTLVWLWGVHDARRSARVEPVAPRVQAVIARPGS